MSFKLNQDIVWSVTKNVLDLFSLTPLALLSCETFCSDWPQQRCSFENELVY